MENIAYIIYIQRNKPFLFENATIRFQIIFHVIISILELTHNQYDIISYPGCAATICTTSETR